MAHSIAVQLRQLVQLLWVMFLLVCVTAVGALHLESEEIDRLTLALGPAVDANAQVMQAMAGAQLGLNGYELSKDRSMLQPFFGAQSRTKASLAALHDTLALAHPEGAPPEADLETRQRLATEQWWAFATSAEQSLARGQRTDVFQGRALFSKFAKINASLGEHLTTERDSSRQLVRNISSFGMAASIVVTLAALIAAFLLGRRAVGAISWPLAELRDTLTRQREGDVGARASVDQHSTEMRSLAVSFNALTDQNLGLLEAQAHALSMNKLTFGIAGAVRAASDTQQALEVICVTLGEGLGADRVMLNTVGANHTLVCAAQWHQSDLPPLGDMSVDLFSNLVGLADEVWLTDGPRVRDDFLAQGVELSERAKAFRRETGASAVITAPIGLGDRVIGMIQVVMVHGPRKWTESEASAVQQVAGFAARAIVNADDQAHRSEYVERLERLDEQKSDFLAMVSHELRTPLTSISGYLELLREGDAGELTVQQHTMLEVVDRNTDRLRSLIEDVLVLSRIEDGVPKTDFLVVSIRTLITRVGEEMRLLAERNAIALEIDMGPDTAFVLGDKASLERALVNIVSNAIKFSRPGGIVTIGCVLDHEACRVLITCQDRGVGIPAQDQGHLFTRFFRASNATDQSIPGTGLGLSIVKQIVEDHHGGALRLISIEGEGTTVVMDLPLLESEGIPEAAGIESLPADVFDIRA